MQTHVAISTDMQLCLMSVKHNYVLNQLAVCNDLH